MTDAITQRYPVQKLSVGMFVASLEMPAVNNPFPLEGFYIKTLEEIAIISSYCSHVLVNITKTRCVQEFHCSLQMEVVDIDIVDIPQAIMKPRQYRAKRAEARVRKMSSKPKGKGKLVRLLVMLAACVVIYQMANL